MTPENSATFAAANENAKSGTPLEQFAAAYRLKVRQDECGDSIMPGRFGHLYYDGPRLCLMRLDAPPVQRSRLCSLVGPDGSVWMGDISPDRNGRRVQDIEVRGIRPQGARLAIRLSGAKPRRRISEKRRLALIETLRKARAAKTKEALSRTPPLGLDRDEGAAGNV